MTSRIESAINARHPRRRARPGASLIELLVVLTVVGVILTTSTVTLFRLLQAQSAGAASLARSLTLTRLAADLRRDAHAAKTVDLAMGETQMLTLRGGLRGDVTYTTEGTGLTRRALTATGLPTREDYDCGDATLQWELQQQGRLIALHLRQPQREPHSTGPAAAPPADPLRPALTILAALPEPETLRDPP